MPEPAELEVNQPQLVAVPEDIVWTRIAMNVREKWSRMLDGRNDGMHLQRVLRPKVNSQTFEARLQFMDSLAESC